MTVTCPPELLEDSRRELERRLESAIAELFTLAKVARELGNHELGSEVFRMGLNLSSAKGRHL